MFQDNLLVPSSSFKLSKNNAENTYVCSYRGSGVGSDWFLGTVILASSVSGV